LIGEWEKWTWMPCAVYMKMRNGHECHWKSMFTGLSKPLEHNEPLEFESDNETFFRHFINFCLIKITLAIIVSQPSYAYWWKTIGKAYLQLLATNLGFKKNLVYFKFKYLRLENRNNITVVCISIPVNFNI
jgi:hypothetical protein